MTFSLLKKTFKDPETKTFNYIGKQAESNYDEIHFVRAENAQSSNTIKLEILRSEVTGFRARSMRDNIVNHNSRTNKAKV